MTNHVVADCEQLPKVQAKRQAPKKAQQNHGQVLGLVRHKFERIAVHINFNILNITAPLKKKMAPVTSRTFVTNAIVKLLLQEASNLFKLVSKLHQSH